MDIEIKTHKQNPVRGRSHSPVIEYEIRRGDAELRYIFVRDGNWSRVEIGERSYSVDPENVDLKRQIASIGKNEARFGNEDVAKMLNDLFHALY